MLVWWLLNFCKVFSTCSNDFICVALTSSYSFPLVMFSFNPVFNRFLGLVVEDIKVRSKSSSSLHGCSYCACLYSKCLSVRLCVRASVPTQRTRKLPFRPKNKKGSTMNSLRPLSDSNPDPCTYFTLNYVRRPLYHCAILSVSEMNRPY